MWLFDVLLDRLKTLFAADAAAQFETQFVARQAERRADLLRRADAYAAEGHAALAEELREEALGLRAPVFPAAPPSSSAAGFSAAPERFVPLERIASSAPASAPSSASPTQPARPRRKTGPKRR